MATIGVYGFDADSFLLRLREANIRLLLDVRQRRGVRGPEYAWANSLRLQVALAHARIGYEHHLEYAINTGTSSTRIHSVVKIDGHLLALDLSQTVRVAVGQVTEGGVRQLLERTQEVTPDQSRRLRPSAVAFR